MPTQTEADLAPLLDKVTGIVVIAGGDGTVRAVAKHVVNKPHIQLVLLPLGTANNIAKTLDLSRDPHAILKGLANAQGQPFDVGQVDAPWGREYFLEGAGLGLYADMLADYDPNEGKSVWRAATTVKDVLVDYTPRPQTVSLDGTSISGSFVALELLNTRAIGPRLKLSPDASPADGLLDVVRICQPENVTLFDYAWALLNDSPEQLDNLELLRGRKLVLNWNGEPFHIDAEVRPHAARHMDNVKGETLPGSGEICVQVLPAALQFLVPPREP
jgi:diacylglycerol kinase family enzyme